VQVRKEILFCIWNRGKERDIMLYLKCK